jgi:hypothetical protein
MAMFNKLVFSGLLCLLVFSFPAAIRAEQAAGSIKTLKGDVSIQRGDTTFPATIGMPVYPQDTLKTSANSALGIILHDDTLISLGPDSALCLKEYVFEPKDNRFSVVFSLLKGTFAYLSGVIGKLAPESIRLETPTSTIAVRGTRLLVKVS